MSPFPAPNTSDVPLLDIRPAQEGHAVRGIGRYVTTLAQAVPFPGYVAWRDAAFPANLPTAPTQLVRGRPASGRLGWARDAIRARETRAPVHLPVADVRLARHTPTYLTAFDAIPWRFPADYPAGKIGAIRRRLDAALASHVDSVLTCSQASAGDLVRFLGVSERRIRIVTLAAGHPWPEPTASAGRLRPELMRTGRRYVIAAGGFQHADPRKRLGDLLHALRGLPEEIALVVTGSDGPARPDFMAEAQSLGVAHRLELTGQVPVHDLVELYAGAAAFVFPSAWEGFGLPLVEAMSVGLPCVVSGGGALSEVGRGAAAIVGIGRPQEIADALRELLNSPTRAAAASLAATSRVADFTVELMRRSHLKAYSE